jgi:positive regulator of sigma E activity
MFPALLAAGYLLGKWVGQWLGLGESAAIVGAALGAVGAFIELFRWASRAADE